MSTQLLNKVLSVGEGRHMKTMLKRAEKIGDLEDDYLELTAAEIREKTAEFKQRHRDGESLEDLLPEAFALVREAAKRTVDPAGVDSSEVTTEAKLGRAAEDLPDEWDTPRDQAEGMVRLYDVQLVGAMALHDGKIAEMKTGEGKTFASAPTIYLNALTEHGVHVVTVNDYLARRDANWMWPLFELLGISVGVIQSQMPEAQRRTAYFCDVTYGTNSEFGFDYLRDNMAVRLDDCVQRKHYFCIVDEVDSILIDEARTPLIISGVPEQASETYYRFARVVPTLKQDEDYEVDEKHRTVAPSESGVAKIEKALGIENLYLDVNGGLVNHFIQALKAQALYNNDKEYIVRDGEVLIVDEFTGRVLEGRRYSEGLHQAIEAKEGQKIREENQTLATITLQNYFRLYKKLSGMTGTASTEANEFAKIYEADVLAIPTHRPVSRVDENDYIFKTREGKFRAVVEEVAERQEKGQPVLLGTASVEVSEMLSKMLDKRGVTHNVLNAKHHEHEAEIIASAGQQRSVTIATNMAGRGVDIKLGEGVQDLGGLFVIGTERHESRRIDNQLRGRSGRQGDPGQSRFFLSAEDDLIRIFAGDRIYKILDKLGPGDDLPLDSKMLTKTVEGSQKKVEEQNFNIRKRVLEYDDVMNAQRKVIYSERRRVLEGEDLTERSRDWVVGTLVDIVGQYSSEDALPADWDLDALFHEIAQYYPVSFGPGELPLDDDSDPFTEEDLLNELEDDAMEQYNAREERFGSERMQELERLVLLSLVDTQWREHLYAMDYLREGIHLRALGQKDPLGEYRLEGHNMFEETMQNVKHEFVRLMFRLEPSEEHPQPRQPDVSNVDYTYQDEPVQSVAAAAGTTEPEVAHAHQDELQYSSAGVETSVDSVAVVEQRVTPDELKGVGRNDPCPCGSGKKFKNCYGTPDCGLTT
jgi:preprotein translocase subunit SecA